MRGEERVSPGGGGSWSRGRTPGAREAGGLGAPTPSGRERAAAFTAQPHLPVGLLLGRGAILGLAEPPGISQETKFLHSLLALCHTNHHFLKNDMEIPGPGIELEPPQHPELLQSGS